MSLTQDSPKVQTEKVLIGASLEVCHFCGNEAELKNTWTVSYWVECTHCGAQISDYGGDGQDGTAEEHIASMKRAANQWNGPSMRKC